MADSGSSPLTRGTHKKAAGYYTCGRFIPAQAGNTCRCRIWTRGCPGSSPLTRGTQLQPAQAARHVRFIPAQAGNTAWPPAPTAAAAVHPRSHGEHDGGRGRELRPAGSSPLTRGTHLRRRLRHPGPRFIPAHAGNTTPWERVSTWWTVHSRSRGEHAVLELQELVGLGSSPLTGENTPVFDVRVRTSTVHPRSRGEHPLLRHVLLPAYGSTPLTRGTPAHTAACSLVNTVDARSRGEHALPAPFWRSASGSSPLTRGTQRFTCHGWPPGRFIPAHAGNTWRKPIERPTPPVHPRSREEHCVRTVCAVSPNGSSPLTRRTPMLFHPFIRQRRFIPAHAGNTLFFFGTRQNSSVHPRSRGEHGAGFIAGHGLSGSSPLTRGTLAGRPHGRR